MFNTNAINYFYSILFSNLYYYNNKTTYFQLVKEQRNRNGHTEKKFTCACAIS